MRIKRTLSILLTAVLAVFLLLPALTAAAYTTDKSLSTYRSMFQDGNASLDYCFFSPVKNGEDTTKYPLIVWLHGNESGNYPRHQLDHSDIGFWASSGAQSYFSGGGAFVFLPRSQTGAVLAWEGRTAALKSTIDAFISQHAKNIDKSKIYIGGYSMGGKAAFMQLAKHPGFYAAGFLMSPMYTPTTAEFEKVRNIPLWIFSCRLDLHGPPSEAVLAPTWNSLCGRTAVPDKVRWTRFDAVYAADGSVVEGKRHDAWNSVVHDLFTSDNVPLSGMHTVDANGNTVKLEYPNGFLSWLNSQQKSDEPPAPKPPEPNGFVLFFRQIADFIRRFFEFLSKLI